MKLKVAGAVLLALILALSFVSVASAAGGPPTTLGILGDATDGRMDGHWTAAQIAAALAWVQSSPLAKQYSDAESVLGAFLASFGSGEPGTGSGNTTAGVSSGALAFTGANLLVAFGAGVGLIGGGLLLRRRSSQ